MLHNIMTAEDKKLLANKRIIYIEDEERNKMLVQLLVENSGGEVWFDRYGTPATALGAVMDHLPVDLILMDLMLTKGFTGYDIMELLQKQPATRDIPVVILSAADASTEMPKARRLGANGYIEKPIDAVTFTQQLADLIDGDAIWS